MQKEKKVEDNVNIEMKLIKLYFKCLTNIHMKQQKQLKKVSLFHYGQFVLKEMNYIFFFLLMLQKFKSLALKNVKHSMI